MSVGLVVANAGTVAMPSDGDPRASYLVVEDGEARAVRVEYDVEREATLVERSGYPTPCGSPRCAVAAASFRRGGMVVRVFLA